MTVEEVKYRYFDYVDYYFESNHFDPHSDAQDFIANEIATYKNWTFERALNVLIYIIINY